MSDLLIKGASYGFLAPLLYLIASMFYIWRHDATSRRRGNKIFDNKITRKINKIL